MQVTVRRQITVSLENRVGRLAAVTAALAERGVNIEAISVADTIDQAVVRFVPSDPALTRSVLGEGRFHVLEADVLKIETADVPGRLAQVSLALADAKINIDYAYGGSTGANLAGTFVLKVSDISRARELVAALPG
jgi:hypothetical protein